MKRNVFYLIAFMTGSLAAGPQVTIFHTNDLQSRLLGFGPNAEYSPDTTGDDATVGGFARLVHLLQERRKARAEDTQLTLDGGDITMGTLFHTVTRETGGELTLMRMAGYDAAVLGNHDFDFRPRGTAQMIRSALKSGPIPRLVLSNVKPSKESELDDEFEALYTENIITPYTIIEKNGLRFGIFGLLGKEAWFNSKTAAPLLYTDPIESGKAMIAHLKKEKVDMIILCSHSGIDENARNEFIGTGEEIDFARAMPEIDVIVGGHSHTAIFEPAIVGGRTPVLQAGSEARYLGEAVFTRDGERWKMTEYKLHRIDDSIPGDRAITARIEVLKTEVSRRILEPLKLLFDQPIIKTGQDLTRDFNDPYLGNILAEAIRQAGEGQIAITSNGVIRDDVIKGKTGIQQVSDIFRLSPLGIGEVDDAPGYPLIKYHFTGKDLKAIAEILAVGYRMRGNSYYPRMAGIRFYYNPYRMPFDTVYKIEIGTPESGYQEIPFDEEKLYSVVVTSYVGQFMSLIPNLSRGLLNATPRHADGKPVEKLSDAIIDADPGRAGIQEIKEYAAVMLHLKALKDNPENDLASFPLNQATGEIRMVRSPGISTLFKNAGLTYLYLPLLGGLGALIFWLIRRRRRKQA
ncbi:MAG: bifunctional metallophosphatase/5'-nucleotidase [Spirochaetales bacterium]|nr:bifunctional metallophosphatase/5'-nucleotidase [Spirochaetales bacterium]